MQSSGSKEPVNIYTGAARTNFGRSGKQRNLKRRHGFCPVESWTRQRKGRCNLKRSLRDHKRQ